LRRITLFILCVVTGALVSQAQQPSGRKLLPPPDNTAILKIGGNVYASGDAYVSSHADTALLKPFGFRRFDFQGWSLGRAHYAAVWPLNVALDSLPFQLDELSYRTVEKDEGVESAFPGEIEQPLPPQVEAPSQRNADYDFSDGRFKSRAVDKDYQGVSREDYWYDDSQLDSRDSPRSFAAESDANWNGDIVVQPIKEGTFVPPEDVISDDYYWYHPGTVIRNPIESDPGQPARRIITNDPRQRGTFFSTSVSRTTLTPTPIQQLNSSWRGHIGFPLNQPDHQPRTNYRASGELPEPVEIPVTDYQYLYGRQQP
jgi:hypothetical protein